MWRVIGLLMMIIAPIAPTLLWTNGDALVTALSGNDPTPNQNAMVVAGMIVCGSVVVGIAFFVCGLLLLIRNPSRDQPREAASG